MHTWTIVLFLFYDMCMSTCVTVFRDTSRTKRDTKIDLSPLLIPSGLEDIIIISAPIIDNTTVYYLYTPSGEQKYLNINTNNISSEYAKRMEITQDYTDISVKHLKGELKSIVTPVNRYKIFNVNFGKSCLDEIDTYAEYTKDMLPNDFFIGPLHEEDHGNWVLSMHVKNKHREIIELFQVITIEILETVPSNKQKPTLYPGETFELSFAYPIDHLETCEIIAPRSTFDRFYERSRVNLNTCGFTIGNVTKADQGMWRIIGVGKIVYETTVYLEIKDKIT